MPSRSGSINIRLYITSSAESSLLFSVVQLCMIGKYKIVVLATAVASHDIGYIVCESIGLYVLSVCIIAHLGDTHGRKF